MKSYTLRLSDDLHARLVKSAGDSHRSLQAEIIFRLEQSFQPAVVTQPQVLGQSSATGPTYVTTNVSPTAKSTTFESERPRAGRRTLMCAHRVPVTAFCARCD